MNNAELTFTIKFVFGFLSFFLMGMMVLLIYKYPLVNNDLVIFIAGQVSIVFVLIARHVFKSGFKIE